MAFSADFCDEGKLTGRENSLLCQNRIQMGIRSCVCHQPLLANQPYCFQDICKGHADLGKTEGGPGECLRYRVEGQSPQEAPEAPSHGGGGVSTAATPTTGLGGGAGTPPHPLCCPLLCDPVTG